MKNLTLNTVMDSLSIYTCPDGYELLNAAGKARYDAFGVRRVVMGIPEYFPMTISVELPASAAPSSSDADPSKAGKPGIGDLLDMQNSIADQLDHLKGSWEQALGTSSEGKVPVVMLGGRYTAIGGGYTPEEISAAVEHIQAIRSGKEFSKAAKEVSPFAIKDGEVFIKDAFIGNGITTANWSMKVNTDESGHLSAAGMGIDAEDGDKKVRFLAESFKVGDEPILRAEVRAIRSTEVKTRLSDDMRDAVIDAICESDVFKALQASQDAQASALATTQQAIEQAASDAIRNALKPGGLLFGKR